MKKKRIKKIKTKRIVFAVFSFLLFVFGISTYFKTYSEFVTSVSRQKSGVVDNIVYVNDAEADYYTYMTENYTYSANENLPTTISKNLYARDDFAELTITYSGKDLVTNEIGYVSTTENQDTYIYYKVLPINDNGTASNKNDDYVLLELIDNPFAKRPNNYGFNGWITNYQGSTIYLDKVYYVRYAKIPVSYESNKPKPIEITFNAKWIDAKTVKLSDSNSRWATAFNELDDDGFVLLGSRDAIYEDMSGYYIVHYYNTGYNGRYPDGALDDDLNDMSGQPCRYYCQYYTVADSEYDPDEDYYEYSQYYGMQYHNAQIIGYNEDPGVPANSNIAGYYKLVHFDNNEDYSNVYSSNGAYIESGTCSGWNGCDYYELQGYYDSNGNPNITDGTRSLYYLVTRDTNVIIFDRNMSSVWGSSQNKPFTLTGINGNTVTTNYLSINSNGVYINTYNDTRIEYIEIYTNQSRSTSSPSSSTRRMIYANFNNLKIGRGIRQDGTYVNALAVIGGNTSTSSQGSSTNPLRYRVIVESGRYNNISVSQAALGSGSSKPTLYTNGQLIAGNDYDRVKEDNDNLEVYENMNGTFGGKYVEDSDHDPLFSITLKSGKIGTSKNAYSTGIYVGGHGYSTDSISGTMKLKVEGGWAYNLIGGPLVSSTYQNRNVVDITMTGGSVESIYGGAGDAATYGNRIIKVLGGVVNFSVFGGSNGYQSDEGKGTLNGSTYIYIGGNATIGLEANVNASNTTMFGAEAGSVFGIGNGKTGSSTIGSCDNSNIIINDNAKILKNVYGGGNYGATGVNSTSSTTTTTIKMLNGEVSGSIYGGGNNNGSGSSSKASTINLTVENGTVKGNVYGGSKTLGRVYGDTNVTVNGGKVTNVYGGGEGGYSSSTNYGTFVSGNVNVTIGSNESSLTPEITKVYGGSAFGTVNGTNNTTTVQNKTTKVTVNKGTITQVFGGGEGNNTYTPYVEGNITVTINNGTITDVYGGNDAKGTPNGTIDVYVNNGTITNTYGGGNLAPINTSTVYLNGGTSTNVYGGGNLADATTTNVKLQGATTTNIYGGSNQSGTVNTSNITISSGSATTVYGGNNLGGTTKTTNITMTGGTATTVYGGGNEATTTTTHVNINSGTAPTVYGGGNKAETGTTYVDINGGTVTTVFGGGEEASTNITNVTLNGSTITSVYGGGNKAGVTGSTNVTLDGSTVTNLYGGSNESGNVAQSNITITSGSATTVYGGNNLGGTTTSTNIDMNGGSATTIYGGGNKATTGTTDVEINSGSVTQVFGGGNEAGTTTTNVTLNGSTITSVYGGGNKAGVTGSTNVVLDGSTVTNLYGGSNQSGDVAKSNITVTTGSATTIYGGNNLGGTTTSTNIDMNGGSATTIYGGGNKATTGTTDVEINSGNVTTVFGGGNEAETTTTNVTLNGSTITDVYGGGNKAGVTGSTNVTLDGSTVTNLYGGSNQNGDVNESNITVTSGTATLLFGGNNLGGSTTTTDIDVNGGTIDTIYGGGNEAETDTTDVLVNGGSVTQVFGGGNKADVVETNVDIHATTNTISNVYGGGNEASAETTNVKISGGAKITNVFGGSNQTGTVDESNITIPFSGTAPVISNIYGGNNQGGQTISANIDTKCGQIGNIYGGGNYATTTSTNTKIQGTTVTGNVYGGGNQASVLNNSTLKIINSRISDNVFGGGNLGTIGKNTDVFVSDSILNKSLFAGGNGYTAVVYGNTLLNIEGTTSVANHVFGGGNAAATGTEEENNSSSVVNIAGLTCGGNVYGGANTSVLYGTVNVNIGSNAITGSTLNKGDVHIAGTVFGGGEANASGSEIYDFSFISVTTGITINIDGYTYDNFDIDGSIFGSGNASSTSGYSNVNIRNYGTEANYKENVSIQRASVVTLDNSAILLTGATDRTNEYSDVLFSLSRLDELKLLNNSTIYLENSTNLVRKFTSAKTIVNGEEKAAVEIDEDGVESRNVDNKLYIYAGRNVNIATNENITAYGEVSGMTFFGMFLYDRNGKVETALYKTEYDNDSTVDSSEIVYFTTGSYVLGKHNTNHNIEVDGFYSNFPVKDATDKIAVKYIVPTPEDAGYYMWSIGEQVASYEISLTASKYSTLGTYELPLINFSAANTTFSVLGFNYNELNPDVNLVDKADIPRIADSGSDADNTIGLVMKSSETGWITKGTTTYFTNEDNHYSGVTSYLSENSSVVPTFLFYLYHSKNLETSGNMGSVTISMVAITPIDDLNNEVKRVNIIVNLSRALFTTDDYEGTITTGKVYEMFAPGVVNITTTSSFTTYYSLFVEKDETIYRNGYHRVLASTYNFPANTKITMIDLLSGTNPEYYYYVVSENDYRTKGQELAVNGDVSYSLDKFIRMGSSNANNHYDDAAMNLLYYDEDHDLAEEEFIFIVDFKEAGINEDVLNKSLLLELRDNDNQIIYSVIGVQQQQLFYNLYANKESVIDLTGSMGTNEVYIGEKVPLLVETNFVQQVANANNVVDTNFYDYRTGIKLSILDSNGDVVNGPSIMGISYTLGTNTYYPRFDGTVRINVAERIANVSSNIIINTEGSNLASGDYTMLIESFGSPDGIYYGLVSSDQEEIPFTVKNTLYGLKVVASERQLIVKKDTGITEDGANAISFNLQYSSGLLHPNLRIALYRRDYDDIYSDIYRLVDFKDFFTNDLATTNRNKTYMLFDSPESTMSTVLYLKDNLTSGTYKIVFGLYDNDTYIGDVCKYIIIK